MQNEHRAEQHSRLPSMESHVIALMFEQQQDDSTRRRQQEVRQTCFNAQRHTETRLEDAPAASVRHTTADERIAADVIILSGPAFEI